MENTQTDARDRVDTKHPDYDTLYEKRALYRRVMAGVDALIANAEYDLPQLPAESDADYEDRKKVATLNNYLRKGVKVLTGLVFQKPITLGDDVPKRIVDICENIDKQGSHIDIFGREGFELGFEGYAAIVTDKPSATATNRAEQSELNLDPFTRLYNADSIWNWKERINPASQAVELSLIVFKEETEEADGRFGSKTVCRYRVYSLDDEGNVFLEVWRVPDNDGDPVIEQEPRRLNVSKIPVSIVGKLGTISPLYDIARKTREHFQVYSIMMADAKKTCVPMRVIEGGSADSIPPVSGSVTICPPESSGGQFGKAYFIEVEGKSITTVQGLLHDIANDIALMTNSLLADKNVTADMTATGEVIDNAAETSELRVMANKYQDALEQVLGLLAEFDGLGKDAGGSLTLGATWTAITLSTQQITAFSNLVSEGQMSQKSLTWFLHASGYLPPDMDVEEELAELEADEEERAESMPVINAARLPNEESQNSDKDEAAKDAKKLPNIEGH